MILDVVKSNSHKQFKNDITTFFCNFLLNFTIINPSVFICRNIQLAKTTFSETNKKLAQTLIQDFFQLLPQNNWENIEVENYWKQMVSASIKQKSNL